METQRATRRDAIEIYLLVGRLFLLYGSAAATAAIMTAMDWMKTHGRETPEHEEIVELLNALEWRLKDG